MELTIVAILIGGISVFIAKCIDVLIEGIQERLETY